MKNNLFKISAILILVIFQLSFLNKVSFLTFIPNLIFIISIILVIRGFLQDGLLVAVLGGLFLDLSSPFRFGFYTLILILILLFLQFVIMKNIPILNPLLILLITTSAFILVDLITCLLVRTWPNWQIFVSGGINGFLSILIYFLSEKYLKQEEIKFS